MNNTLFGVDGMRKDALSHHGILGQKWGIRRYQNPDGSLTSEGQRRYLKEEARRYKKAQRKDAKIAKKEAKAEAALQKRKQEIFDSDNYKQFHKNRKLFSDKEIDAYIAKQQKEKQLRTAMRDHNNRLLDKASYGVERIAKVADTGVKAIDTYNKLAKIVNSVYGTEKLSKLDPESKKKEKMAKRRKSLMKLTPAEIMANYEKLDSDDIEYLSNRWKGLGTVGENYGKVEKITRLYKKSC